MKSFLVAAFVILSVCSATAQDTSRCTQLHDSLNAICIRFRVPALAGAIVTSDGVQLVAVAGVRKSGTTIPVEVNDLWHLGSDTKAITATLIASLVNQKILTWVTTIGDAFPELETSLSKEILSITIEQLLSHHSGLPENAKWAWLSKRGTVLEQRKASVLDLKHTKLVAKPGAAFHYSNYGYVVVGAMVENITHDSWENLVRKHVCEPLHMSSIGFGGTGTPGKIDQPWPHDDIDHPMKFNGPKMDNPEIMSPAGRIHCTISDWGLLIADQLRGETSQHALLPNALYTKMHTPPFGGEYALGWSVASRPWGGGTVFTHNGSNGMNYAVVWMAPKNNVAVLVCCNQGGDEAGAACDAAARVLIWMSKRKESGK